MTNMFFNRLPISWVLHEVDFYADVTTFVTRHAYNTGAACDQFRRLLTELAGRSMLAVMSPWK